MYIAQCAAALCTVLVTAIWYKVNLCYSSTNKSPTFFLYTDSWLASQKILQKCVYIINMVAVAASRPVASSVHCRGCCSVAACCLLCTLSWLLQRHDLLPALYIVVAVAASRPVASSVHSCGYCSITTCSQRSTPLWLLQLQGYFPAPYAIVAVAASRLFSGAV